MGIHGTTSASLVCINSRILRHFQTIDSYTMDTAMNIEDLLQNFPELSRGSVENAVAESLHEMFNKTCENAHNIREEHRKLQAEVSSQEYKPLRAKGASIPEYVPMQLVKDNIHANGLDADRWRSTIQAYTTTKLEAYVSSISDPATAKSVADALEHFKACLSLSASALSGDGVVLISERMANRNLEEVISSGNRETLSEHVLALAQLASTIKDDVSVQGVVIIPILVFLLVVVGSSLYMALVLISARNGHSLRITLQSDYAAFHAAVQKLMEKIAKARAQQEVFDKANLELLQKQRRNQDERYRKKDKIREDEVQKAKRKDYYFGSVVAIVPLERGSGEPHGYAIRIEAIKETLLSDDTLLQRIKKITVADNITPTVGANIYCLEIYCHSVPSDVKAGVWVNFELNMKSATPATYAPVLPAEGNFDDGLCWIEETSPYASFAGGSLGNFGKTDHGFKATVDMGKIKRDIPQTALDKLRLLFERTHVIRQNITNFFRFSDVIEKTSISLDQYKTADHYIIANVGQGATGLLCSSKEGWKIVSDFGFGKGDRDFSDMIDVLISETEGMPMMLSHWDRDHYRIADSKKAKLLRDTNLCPTLRHWIVPDQPLTPKAFDLACSIQAQGHLEACIMDEYGPPGGNWKILRCQSPDMNDKNNHGALALIIGLNDGDHSLLYPGDANYEYIHNISQYDGTLFFVIATHHGSELSLKVSRRDIGDSIPRSVASAAGSTVFFSFGKGNSYGHSVEKVVKLYRDHGYKKVEATADLAQDKDLLVAYVDPYATSQLPNPRPIPGVPKDVAVYHDMESYFAFMKERLKSSGIAHRIRRESSAPPVVADAITLDGANKDTLEPFAIRDKFEQIVKYHVLARKLIIRNCPLLVKCESDVPIRVLLQCEDIELYATAPSSTPTGLPVILFDVKSGDPWRGYADVGEEGMQGNGGYMGGFMDLRVIGNWFVQIAGKNVYKSGEIEQHGLRLEIQYRGGRGGNGGQGGHGNAGVDGSQGTNDKCVIEPRQIPGPFGGTIWVQYVVEGVRATAGGRGGDGGRGGRGGRPSAFPISQVIATKTKVPEWQQEGFTGPCLSVSLVLLTDEGMPFGASGQAGPGGHGGLGGHGGIQGQRFRFISGRFEELTEESFKSAPDGPVGNLGYPGDFGGNPPNYGILKPNVIICTTEEETHDRFMEEELV